MQVLDWMRVVVGAGAALGVACLSTARAEAEIDADADYDYGDARRGAVALDLRSVAPQPTPPVLQRALSLRASEGAAERPAWLEREQVEAPYQSEDGVWYVPTAEPGYEQTGKASWYGEELAGRRTASGEPFDPNALTGAHPTLPLQSLVQVTNLANGAEVIIRINDRGPFTGGRVIDVSRRAAQVLGFERAGEARVHVRYLGPAPKRAGAARPSQAPSRPASHGADSLFVQVGAFSSRQNAERAQGLASAAGAVEIVSETRNGRLLHKVRVGPLADSGAAETARRRAVDAGFRDAVVLSARR